MTTPLSLAAPDPGHAEMSPTGSVSAPIPRRQIQAIADRTERWEGPHESSVAS